jgi:DNA polymerase-3 subunit alpha
MAGVVTSLRTHTTKKGDAMGFVTVEDLQGSLELVIFPKTWREVNTWLAIEQIVVVYGKVDAKGSGTPKILVDTLRQDLKLATGQPSAPGQPARPAAVQSIIWTDDELPPPDHAVGGGDAPIPTDYTPPPPDEDWFPPPGDDGRPAAAAVSSAQSTEPDVPDPAALSAHSAEPGDSRGINGEGGHGNGNGRAPVRPNGVTLRPRPAPPAALATPQRIVVTLKASGDRERDARLVRRVHNVLKSFPGPDEFEFVVYEANQARYQLRFPNTTTRYCAELVDRLRPLIGEGAVEVQPL